MNPLYIETFLFVVRFSSITEAAKHLFLSQSTVSHRLAMLEKDIGVVLIERKKGIKNISITPSGKRFLEIAERWENITEELHKIKIDGSRSKVTVGAVDSVNTHILSPLYSALQQYSSKLDLRVRTQQSLELYSLVEQQEIDVAFPLVERVPRGIKIEKFFEEPMVMIKKSENSSTSRISSPVSIDQLDSRYELYTDWGPYFRMWHEKWFGLEGTRGVQIDTGELLQTFMTDPKFWAIIPVSMANTFSKINSFSIHNVIESPPKRTCYRIEKIKKDKNLNIFNHCLEYAQKEIKNSIKLNDDL